MPLTKVKRALVRAFSVTRPAPTPLPAEIDPSSLKPETVVPFCCNLCGTPNSVPFAKLLRETPSCAGCGSTVRFRGIADLVARELFGVHRALPDLPERMDLVGIGLSDAAAYARPLAKKLGYTNTWFHTTPMLDIANLPDDMAGHYDFLIASDVFEHVVPPVAKAFANARRLLKPGGVFVFTVPFSLDADTVEHFPDLHDFDIAELDGRWTLTNRTVDGRTQTFDQLVFHGGPGSTLEMRLFSRAALEREFARAGFARMRVADEPCLAHGIVWPEPWSVPMVGYA